MKTHAAARSGPLSRRRVTGRRLAAIGRRTASLLPALALLVPVALAIPPRAALAQQDLAAARDCTTISADALRLACYDRALRSAPTSEAAAVGAQGRSARENGDAARAGEQRGNEIRPESLREDAGPSEPREAAGTEHEASTKPEPETSSPPAVEIPASRNAAPADAGKSGDFEVTVVEVRTRGQLIDATFVTDDGQVWRQTDGRRVRLPDPPFRAVISSGAFGSHFLSPVGQGLSVRVSQQRR